jgi:hypothetical protein
MNPTKQVSYFYIEVEEVLTEHAFYIEVEEVLTQHAFYNIIVCQSEHIAYQQTSMVQSSL